MSAQEFYSHFLRFSALFLVLLQGCASTPVVKEPSREEIVKRDRAIGDELASEFEAQIKFKQDTEVSVFLHEIAQTMIHSNPDLASSPIGVWTIRDRLGQWQSFSLPGNRIYLPVGLLRRLEYENEIAALIALQLGHILNKSVIDRLALIAEPSQGELIPFESLFSSLPMKLHQEVDFFGPNGIFAFSEDQEIAAARIAVDLLYQGGYDPRGVVSVLTLFRDHPTRSSYESSTLNKLMEHSRHAIAVMAPLRNPIVRSLRFMQMRKRLQHL